MYKAIVIGTGSIGGLKPDLIDYQGSPNILTHSNALDRHPSINFVGCVDKNLDQLNKMQHKWNVQCFSDLDKAMKICNPDIVVVSVPTEYHYGTLMKLIPYKPKLVIGEKPFCEDLDDAFDICHRYELENIPIQIDYIRRFANGYKQFKKDFDNGKYGKVQNARVLYGRGLKHDGVHAIDLMRYFFGGCNYKEILTGQAYNDSPNKNDMSMPVEMMFDKCLNVVFTPCDSCYYGIFEIDICFENYRVRFIDNGLYIEIYPITKFNEWGHSSLDYSLVNVRRQETGLNTALYNLIDNSVNFLDGKEKLICTGNDALNVHRVLMDI